MKILNLIAAVGTAGVLASGSAAFTGTGVEMTAAPTQFVGGTVSQTVTGATLNDIAYSFTDAGNTAVDSVALTFADDKADGKVPTVVATLGSGTPAIATCLPIAAVSHVSTRTVDGSWVGLSSLVVTVASS
jgi:hypothetical protein